MVSPSTTYLGMQALLPSSASASHLPIQSGGLTGLRLLVDPSGDAAQSRCIIHRIAEEEKNQILYKRFSLLASASNLTYKIADCVKRVELDDQEWDVFFYARQSGIEIKGKSVLHLEKEETSIFAVPGTVDENDWLSNICAEQSPTLKSTRFSRQSDDDIFINSKFAIHSGFLNVAESIIKNFLSCRRYPFKKKKEIYFTGHSQGAAVASILALYAQTHRKLLGILPECKISCVTFASPRVFSKNTFDFYMKNGPETYRIFNGMDPVPRVPLGASGFKHVGHPIQLNSSLLQDAVITDIADDLSASLHLDVSATSRVCFSIAKMVYSPIAWVVCAATVPHSMDHYETIVQSENGRKHIVNILQTLSPYTSPSEEEASLVEVPSAWQGPSVRYTPPKGEGEGSLDISLTKSH